MKKRLYRILKGCTIYMKKNQILMKSCLYRTWVTRQENSLALIKEDIERRVNSLKLQQLEHREGLPTSEENITKDPACYQHNTLIRNELSQNNIRKTVQCIRQKEKLLIENDDFFLSDIMNGVICNTGTLRKEWVQVPQNSAIPPPLAHSNNKIISIFEKALTSTNPLITYGDMMRLIEQEDAFIMENDAEIIKDVSEKSIDKYSTTDTSCNKPVKLKEPYLGNEAGNCPLLSRKTYQDYVKMVNENFYPEPNIDLVKAALTFDKNALPSKIKDVLKYNYSFQELKRDNFQKLQINGYQARAVYFFKIQKDLSAVDVQHAFEKYIKAREKFDGTPENNLKGCLIVYTNVALGIAMVEGNELAVFNHFARFKNSNIHKIIQKGRVLYVEQKLTQLYSDRWVSFTVAPPIGKITYLTTTKKIIPKIAEPRLRYFKRKLHKFYNILSLAKFQDEGDSGGEDLDKPPTLESHIHSCLCHCKEKSHGDMYLSTVNVLPSPALISYLLKYKKLKTIDGFLDVVLNQPFLDSEDETYHVFEDAVLKSYVYSDDEEDKPGITEEIKQICKEQEIVIKVKKEITANVLMENEGKEPAWAKKYNIDLFTPRLHNIEIRKTHDTIGRSIKVDTLLDSDVDDRPQDSPKKFVEFTYNKGSAFAERKFVNILESGSERWQKKIKNLSVKGDMIKQILRNIISEKQALLTRESIQSKAESVQEVYGEHLGERLHLGEALIDLEELEEHLDENIAQNIFDKSEEYVFDYGDKRYFEYHGEMPKEVHGEYSKNQWTDQNYNQFYNNDFNWDLDPTDGIIESVFGENRDMREYAGTSSLANYKKNMPEAPPASSASDLSTGSGKRTNAQVNTGTETH